MIGCLQKRDPFILQQFPRLSHSPSSQLFNLIIAGGFGGAGIIPHHTTKSQNFETAIASSKSKCMIRAATWNKLKLQCTSALVSSRITCNPDTGISSAKVAETLSTLRFGTSMRLKHHLPSPGDSEFDVPSKELDPASMWSQLEIARPKSNRNSPWTFQLCVAWHL